MPDLFASLPPSVLSRISEPEGFKNWKICATCHISQNSKPVRACAGCLHMEEERAFYCSRECQKAHWSIHKLVCDRSRTPGGQVLLDQGNALKTLLKMTMNRWYNVNHPVLLWCLENIYHYNTHLDPHTTYVEFYLRPKSMQIWYIGVQQREALYNEPGVQSHPHYYFYTLCVPPSTDSHTLGGMRTLHCNSYNTLSTPATRARIAGHPQWLFIAISLTEGLQPSRVVAEKKCSLLRAAIDSHRSTGEFSSGPEFDIPQFEVDEKVELEDKVVESWFAKLALIDLWGPLLEITPEISSESAISILIDHADEKEAGTRLNAPC